MNDFILKVENIADGTVVLRTLRRYAIPQGMVVDFNNPVGLRMEQGDIARVQREVKELVNRGLLREVK